MTGSPNSPSRPRATIVLVALASVLATGVVLASPALAAVATTDLSEAGDATDLATRLAGDGIAVSGATYTGDPTAAGSFLGGSGIVGLDAGVLLSSGEVSTVIGPNEAPNEGTSFGRPGDADLDALAGQATSDAAVLEFDFVPQTSSVRFDYVFSSEEYLEYVGGGYNDAFGFFVNGTNCALVGEPPVPVTVDTINPGSNSSSFIDNTDGSLDTEMDGLTVVLSCTASVTANATNTMKLAIADSGDNAYDSAVFLGQGTFAAVQPLMVDLAGDGSGAVTSSPAGIDCGADCTEGFEEGTEVSLTATPAEGSSFTGWSGDCTGTGPCDLTMGGPRNVTASFQTDDSSCGSGTDCDEGIVPPGGTLSTVEGTAGNPVTTGDPFALQLKNVSGEPLEGSISEEPCDGTQESDPLCASPRVAGRAGNFRFSSGGGDEITVTTTTGPPPVTIAKIYYDRSAIRAGAPIKIFYQKASGDPVIRLPRCGDGVRTECFTVKRLGSGDQIVKVPLSGDPRVTRG